MRTCRDKQCIAFDGTCTFFAQLSLRNIVAKHRNEKSLHPHVGHEGIGHGRGAGTGDADPTRIACRDPTSLAYQELARKALAVERLAYRGKDTNVAAVKHRDSKD